MAGRAIRREPHTPAGGRLPHERIEGGSRCGRGGHDLSGRARAAQPALVDGTAGLVWAQGGRPRVVFRFTIAQRKIGEIEMVADPERLGQLDLEVLRN